MGERPPQGTGHTKNSAITPVGERELLGRFLQTLDRGDALGLETRPEFLGTVGLILGSDLARVEGYLSE